MIKFLIFNKIPIPPYLSEPHPKTVAKRPLKSVCLSLSLGKQIHLIRSLNWTFLFNFINAISFKKPFRWKLSCIIISSTPYSCWYWFAFKGGLTSLSLWFLSIQLDPNLTLIWLGEYFTPRRSVKLNEGKIRYLLINIENK